ncbi:hypothetical protein A1O7_03816 [Cladophialophora yegresii CBS 114405]|uniref:Uncharacterized protein n=1 Tax=Cladophialophora yegresii CBS 114405 TaxID=1182544 RepID=W9W3T9_9EURO|nr:uncharacterized protein A1O7_03816 [Cladophialophora yegresii CBS 114405]EXJ59670.1 hypothetical protein A1O7_03816 [Cladophialophora yegresii CBS 114405]
MTPNITKGQTDTSKFTGEGPAGKDAHPNKNPVQEYNPAPGAKAPALSSDGTIGKQFTADGSIGSIPQSIGGPFDQNGVIGHAFKEDGAIGGTMNKVLGHTPGDKPTNG